MVVGPQPVFAEDRLIVLFGKNLGSASDADITHVLKLLACFKHMVAIQFRREQFCYRPISIPERGPARSWDKWCYGFVVAAGLNRKYHQIDCILGRTAGLMSCCSCRCWRSQWTEGQGGVLDAHMFA
ncbi:hypothetical protein [Andreprevotia chitinilytica]|uniref:hypothetical protein n=1 Tax=Andreprevotia chitinilytica TaxID=396808 RepID=UPI003571614F